MQRMEKNTQEYKGQESDREVEEIILNHTFSTISVITTFTINLAKNNAHLWITNV